MAMPWLCPWEGLLLRCDPACPRPWDAASPGNYALSWRGNPLEKWGLSPGSSLLEGLAWVWVAEGPNQFWEFPGLQPASDLLLHSAGGALLLVSGTHTDYSPNGSLTCLSQCVCLW